MIPTQHTVSERDHFIVVKSDSSIFITEIDYNGDEKFVFINGVSLDKYVSIPSITRGDEHIFYVHFNDNINSSLTLHFSNEESIIINQNEGKTDQENWTRCEKLIDNDTSFQLLRVNPKLTGNIKVMIDSNSNMYLDTFKVSKGLSQRKYRKIKINPDEYYGKSIMSKMSSLTSDDFYKIEDSCYSLFSTVNNIGDEYYDLYNSGVRTNTDKLYNENYSLLAPLCIKKRLPDFFVVFKCKNIPEFTTNEERIEYMIKNGTVVKSYDMREGSNIGKYIRNIYNNSSKYPGYMFVSYDYNGNNTYNGISIDRGVVASHYEATSLERGVKNQVALNDWYTLGFERNRIVAKDIINFEFLFDDKDEQLFTITNYFGFYIRLNGEDKDFTCIGTNGNEYVFDTNISGVTFDPSKSMNSIYGFSTPNEFFRCKTNIKNVSPINKISEYKLKPYKCIFSSDVIEYDNNISFISCKLKDFLNAGEHYRIIDMSNATIYDVVISNYKSVYDVSDVNYTTQNIDGQTYNIFQVSVYNIEHKGNHSDDLKLSEHLSKITTAFNKFNDSNIIAYNDGDNVFSITYNRLTNIVNGLPDLLFEKVLSECGYNDTLKKDIAINDNCDILGIEQTSEDDYIKLSTQTTSKISKLLYPMGFESLGDRMCKCMSFVPSSMNGSKMCMFKDDPTNAISNHNTILYQDNNNTYNHSTTEIESNNVIKLVDANITSKNYISVDDSNIKMTNIGKIITLQGFGEEKTFVRFFPSNKMPKVDNNKLRLYQNYPINAGVCSIFPVKDFNTDIYDTRSHFSLNPQDGNISNENGYYRTVDTLTGDTVLSAPEEYMCDYIDKNEKFKSLNTTMLSRISDSFSDYVKNLLNNNHTKSDICLTVPYCCKWQSVGNDHTGKPMRIMYPFIGSKYTELNTKNKSYNIPSDSSIGIGLICTDASITQNFEKYANNLLSTTNHKTFRDYILYGDGCIDDLLYFSDDDNQYATNSNKFSRTYSHGNNTIEFIYGGVKMQLTTSNSTIVDMSKYNNYSIVVLCMTGNNPARENNAELIIDETKGQIALIYYNGTQGKIAVYEDNNISNDEKQITKNINHVVQVPFNKPITDTKMSAIDTPVIAIPDDAGFFDNTVISDGDSALIVISSPIKDNSSYTKDKYNVIFCNPINDKPYNDNFKNCILGKNVKAVIDSSLIEQLSNGVILTEFDKLSSSSDMFIYNPCDTLSTKNEGEKVLPKFIELSKFSKIDNDIAIYIKSNDNTRDYSGKNGIVSLSVVQPLTTHRELSDFSKSSLNTNVHPTYCEPMFKNVFTFKYSSTELNNTFGKNFDGCNTILDTNTKVHNLSHVWLRKYMANASEYTKGISDNTVSRKFKVVSEPTIHNIKLDEYFKNTNTNGDDKGTYKVKNVTSEALNKYQHTLNCNDASFTGNEKELPKQGNIVIYDDVKYVVDEASLSFNENDKINGYIKISTLYQNDNIHDKNISNVNIMLGNNTLSSIGSKSHKQYFIRTIMFDQPTSSTYPANKGSFTKINTNESFTYDSFESFTLYVGTKTNYTTTLTELKDFSPVKSCFENKMFRTFLNLDTYSQSTGIDTGYEKNTFFGSRGIQLKTGNDTNTITLTKWTRTELDKSKKKIRLNVTDTLINFITFSPGFESNWTSFSGAESFNKTKYIMNSIMKNIDITSSCVFKMYTLKNSRNFDYINYDNLIFEEVSNTSNKLIQENNTYYIEIDNLDEKIYSATLTIKI